ncbi:hypothetical protein GOP47_0005581 [Adiantum capillus-veneris]|uniref:Uncharacterized protein n=1 Tax=Adiantum capillus-veneris TaxID=13818 RepID=A0A9D4V621_ADICA|nr:hypothetical protein GOP47_0005581 [Adiantum capillus-veneris]
MVMRRPLRQGYLPSVPRLSGSCLESAAWSIDSALQHRSDLPQHDIQELKRERALGARELPILSCQTVFYNGRSRKRP